MKKRIVVLLGAGALALGITGVASAGDPFLCPIVGGGTTNATNNKNVIPNGTPAGYSLLPGNNQAGENANANAINGNGEPGIATNNPGHNPEYTPIWPG